MKISLSFLSWPLLFLGVLWIGSSVVYGMYFYRDTLSTLLKGSGRAVNSGYFPHSLERGPFAGACRRAGCGTKASRPAATPQLRPQDKVRKGFRPGNMF